MSIVEILRRIDNKIQNSTPAAVAFLLVMALLIYIVLRALKYE